MNQLCLVDPIDVTRKAARQSALAAAKARGERTAKAKPTLERARELLTYCADTGVFRWNVSRNYGPAAVVSGNVAGSDGPRGYKCLTIDGTKFQAHRVAFFMTTGRWPDGDVDHINGVRDDNRWANLREATRSQNNENIRRARRNSGHGFLGVSRAVRSSGVYWIAHIQVRKKSHYLGCFKTPEEAHAVYMRAKAEMHEFAPGKTLPAASSNGSEKPLFVRGPRA